MGDGPLRAQKLGPLTEGSNKAGLDFEDRSVIVESRPNLIAPELGISTMPVAFPNFYIMHFGPLPV